MEQPPENPRTWIQSVGWWAFRGIAAVLIFLAGVLVAIHLTVDEAFVEHHLTRAVHALPGGERYTVQVEDVWLSPFVQNLTLRRLAVTADQDTLAHTPTDAVGARHLNLRVEGVGLEGPHCWQMLWHHTFAISALTIDRPSLLVPSADDPDKTVRWSDTTRRGGWVSTLDSAAQRFPSIAVDRFRLRRGLLRVGHDDDRRGTATGVSFTASNLRMHLDPARDTARISFSRNVRFGLSGLNWSLPNTLYRMRTGSIRGAAPAGRLRIDSLRVAPRVPDSTYFRRVGDRTTRYRLTIPSIQLTNLQYGSFLRRGAVFADRVTLRAPYLDAYVDKRVPERRLPSGIGPQAFVQQLEWPLRLDTVRIEKAAVRYAEQPPYGGPVADILFSDLQGTVTDMYSVSPQSGPMPVARGRLSSTVAGDGRLSVQIEIPLLSPDVPMTYSGSMGSFDPTVLNTMFVPVNGVEVTSGRVDSVRFLTRIRGTHAEGKFRAVYRDLSLRFIDAEDRRQGLADALKSFTFRTFAFHADNHPTENQVLRTGTIDHELEKGDTFVKFLWHSVRSGIISLVTR